MFFFYLIVWFIILLSPNCLLHCFVQVNMEINFVYIYVCHWSLINYSSPHSICLEAKSTFALEFFTTSGRELRYSVLCAESHWRLGVQKTPQKL